MSTPPKVIGVICAGTMGAGIAQLACLSGADTWLHDPVPDALERGIRSIEGHLARSVERALTSRGLLNPRDGEGSYGFRCTGEVGAFSALATRFLQMPVGEVQHVDLSVQAAAAA